MRKEDRACCMAKVDDLGRPPIGYCGPKCQGRIDRDRLIDEHRRLTGTNR